MAITNELPNLPSAQRVNDHHTLRCTTRTAAGAWALVRAVARKLAFTTVTPTMIAHGANPKYQTPLVLFAAPYAFELCQVRNDGFVGFCFLTIAITEPHNAASSRHVQQPSGNDMDGDITSATALPLLMRAIELGDHTHGWPGDVSGMRKHNTKETA